MDVEDNDLVEDVGKKKKDIEKIQELSRREDILDARFGFSRITEGPERLGWLINMKPVRAEIIENDMIIQEILRFPR